MEVFVESIEQELADVVVSEESREERLKKKNVELNEKLREKMEQHDTAVREIASLKITIVEQVSRATTALVSAPGRRVEGLGMRLLRHVIQSCMVEAQVL